MNNNTAQSLETLIAKLNFGTVTLYSGLRSDLCISPQIAKLSPLSADLI